MRVVLQSDTELLDEVIVVAYGTAKKSSLTGAVSSIDAQTIEKSISTSVTGALEGSSPGIQVNNTYGEPGTDPYIRIRGIGSINGSNEPLYVLDGAPYNGNISDLNASDIESITVLKDAASAALFGNRAANGVILITTKTGGSSDRASVTVTINHGAYTRGVKEYARLDADRWMEAQWTGMKNYAMSLAALRLPEEQAAAYATANLIGDLVRRNIYNAADNQLFNQNGNLTATRLSGYDDLNWADALERTGYRQEYGISLASNGEKHNIYASLGYLGEDGYIINTAFKRYTGRINASFNPTTWLKAGVNLATTSQTQNYNSSAYSSYVANPFYASRYMAPVYPIYLHNSNGSYVLDNDGNKVFDTTSSYLGNRHIVYELLNDIEKNERLTVDASAFATIVLPYGLEATVKGTKYYSARRYSSYDNPEIGDGAASGGRLANNDYRYATTNFLQQLNWSQDYDLHHIDALLGHESYKYQNNVVYGMNTSMSITGNITLGNFTTNSYYSGYNDNDATESYLARARYSYDNKYFFETSFRRDGSSRFHPDNRWGNFFSLGGAWDITREDFMKGIDWVDYLKLRASYGEVGNNSIGISGRDGLSFSTNYYAYRALYYLAKNGGVGSLVLQSLSADHLQWETTQTIDVALEANLFKRLDLSIGYFNKRSKDLLFAMPLPSSAGGYIWGGSYNLTQLQNLGSISNRGVELSARVNILKTRDLKWDVGIDATFLKNKIEKLPNGEDIANGTIRRYSEGKSIYEFYTYHFVGIDQMTGRSLYTINPEQVAAAATANTLVTINEVDYTTDTTYGLRDWAGSAVPTVYGSFNTSAEWKGLSLSVLMTYSLGGKVYDSAYQSLMSSSAAGASALHKNVLNAWRSIPDEMEETSPNRINPNGTPILDHNLSQFNNATSDRWLTSASYLVMKNITLSYEIPRRIVRGWGLQNIVVNAGIENVFTLTSRQGLNPQYSFEGTQDATYTTARIFNLGATLKF